MIIENEYRVYIKLNDKREIVAVNSSAFLTDTEGWVEIDSGSGDKYYHAQSGYFDKPLFDEDGLYNYKLADGVVTERTSGDKASDIKRISAKMEISEFKCKLAATDYVAAKIAEGAATAEEYKDVIAKRQQWRRRINELELM